MVVTMKFTAFNTNKNQVPANISWTYQTGIFLKQMILYAGILTYHVQFHVSSKD
jgi:hypothetical protein